LTIETHSNDVDQILEEVFTTAVKKRSDFVIPEENWQLMLDDMTELYGTFCKFEEGLGGPGGPGGGATFQEEDPIFCPSICFFTN
jgi:hypothetical protein